MNRTLTQALLVATLFGCTAAPDGDELPGGDGEISENGEQDLGLGDVSPEDMKADGQWGAALTCKTIPTNIPALPKPKITVSLNGLTLHLVDTTVGYDKVFPIGAGQIVTDTSASAFGESHSYEPLIFGSPTGDFALHPATNTACKTWWTDPDTGEKSPVFAGLPFLSWYGSYGMHGPIDNYRAANGGTLRRGFVSHGCLRMEAADILELYARTKGVATVPVHVQREFERRADGTKVDLVTPWIGAECKADSDCGFTNGFCHANAFSGRKFCSARCTTSCADKANLPTTFCVADPQSPGQGMCVNKVTSQNYDCRPQDHFKAALTGRNTQPSVKATVCVPGSPGWVGDHCFANADCKNGTSCKGATAAKAGVCTQACSGFCPDMPGSPDTFCASQPALQTGGSCVRRCTPGTFASECPTGTACVQRNRFGSTGSAYICEAQ